MKKRTLYMMTAAALAVVLAVPLAFAQQRRMQGQFAPGGMGMFMFRLQRAQQALGLTDQQVSSIKTIFDGLKQQNAPVAQSLRGGMLQIAQTLINDPSNVQGAQALIDQQEAARHTIEVNTLNAASKALNVLTADQRAKLLTMIQNRMNRGAQQQ